MDATEQFVGAWAPSGLKDSTPGTGTWRASPRAFVAVSDCRLQDETTSRRRLKMMSISLAKPTQAPATTSGSGRGGRCLGEAGCFRLPMGRPRRTGFRSFGDGGEAPRVPHHEGDQQVAGSRAATAVTAKIKAAALSANCSGCFERR